MLRISKEQMDWFARKTRREFVAMMSDHLEQHYPECVDDMSRDEIEAWVDDATANGLRYGVATEPEAAQLVLLLLVLGLDADETTPWVRDVLASRDLYAVGKVRRLVQLAREREVEGIEDVVLGEVVDA